MAKNLKVKHFIYTSSVAVYGSNSNKKIIGSSRINPDSIYGVSKFTGEMFVKQMLKNTQIKTTIFRIFNTTDLVEFKLFKKRNGVTADTYGKKTN